jgi:hypothetical protein
MNGYVTDAEHVHHRNRRRDDNRAANLEHLSADDHWHRHASPHADETIRRYVSGETLESIAQDLSCDASSLSRLIKRNGVEARKSQDYRKDLSPDRMDQVRQMHSRGIRVGSMMVCLGVGRPQIQRAMDSMGLPNFRAGRPL